MSEGEIIVNEVVDEVSLGTSEEKSQADPVLLEAMVKAGGMFGRMKSKTHPRMQRYIFTTRNDVEILDIVQTIELLFRATQFITDIVKGRGIILFVGTTPAAKNQVKELAERFGYPHVTNRWLGGTLTNFKTIRERLNYYLKLKSDREAGRLEKYTKKERLGFDREIERLTKLMGGLEQLIALPQAVFIVGPTMHETAMREARRLKIPIVAIASSDADPDFIDYLIPANDRAKGSILWVIERFAQAIEKGKQELPASQIPIPPVK